MLPSIYDVLRASCVSHYWHSLATNASLWRLLFYQNKGWHVRLDIPQELPYLNSEKYGDNESSIDWKQLYTQRFELDRRWYTLHSKMREDLVPVPFQPTITRLQGHSDTVYCCTILPPLFGKKTGYYVTGSRDKSVRIWDDSNESCVSILMGHHGSVLCLAFHDDLLISGSSDATARIWKRSTSQNYPYICFDCIHILEGHEGGILSLDFNKSWILTASRDATVRVWDRCTFDLLHIYRGHSSSINACHLHGDIAASAAGDGSILLWQVLSGQTLRSLSGPRRGVATIQLSHQLCISGSNDKSIRIWDTRSGTLICDFRAHEQLVRSLYYDPSRQLLTSGGWDGKTRIWDLSPLFVPSQLGSIDLPQPQLILELGMHHARVLHVCFDSTRILSACEDKSTWITNFGAQGLACLY